MAFATEEQDAIDVKFYATESIFFISLNYRVVFNYHRDY